MSIPISAQKGIQNGKVRIKFSNTETARLSTMKIEKSADGIARIGVAEIDQLNEKHRATHMKRVFPYAGKFEKKHEKYGLHLWYEVTIDDKTDVTKVSQEYSKLSQISNAEPIYKKTRGFVDRNALLDNVQYSLPSGTNDPRYNEQWHYNNTGQTGGTIDADIDLPEAWMIETGNPDVIVSVHDGGIDYTHNDVSGNMWINALEIAGNGIDDDSNGYVDDIYGYNFADNTGTIYADDHGTHVGGTVAAETNNNIGMSGVAGGTGLDDGARLMSCAVFSNTNGGFPESYIYAADNGAVISQNSWGYSFANDYEQAVLDAIDYFIAEAGYDENGIQTGPMAGGLVIFASGNDGVDDLMYPGYYSSVMAVAGTDHNDDKYIYSNYGDWIELAAPAVNVRSTVPGNEYDSFTGTSMACPHVSGVAALIISAFQDDDITPSQVWERLVNTTDPLTFEGAEGWGTGRLNAFMALAEDDGLPPNAVTDLSIVDADAISVLFSLTAPSDEPNGYTANLYDLRGSTEIITETNFDLATKFDVTNPGLPGESDTLIVSDLSPGTTYYFAIKSEDFFGNQSGISNVVVISTETAPEIVITGTPSVNIDILVDSSSTGTFNISNEGPVELNYDIVASFRGRNNLSSTLLFPGNETSIVSEENQNVQAVINNLGKPSSEPDVQLNFSNEATNIISYDDGDSEADDAISVTAGGTPVYWSAAIAMEVPDMEGENFTLTQVSSYIVANGAANTKPTQLSIVVGGTTPSEGELLLSQEIENVIGSQYVTASLEMPLIFNSFDKFWIVFSFPDVPLSLGIDDVPGENRPNSYLAYLNGEWLDLQNEIGWEEYVWNVRAIESIVDGLTLSISSGTLSSGNNQDVDVTYDASGATRNGDYLFNIFVMSNDPLNPVEKIESTATVIGFPEPSIAVYPDTINTNIDVTESPIKVEMLTITNNGTGELFFDFANPVVEANFHIPAIIGDFPLGSAVQSLGKAPQVNTKEGSTAPVVQLAGTMAYAYDVYPGLDLVSFDTDEPGTYSSSVAVTYTAFAGDFGRDNNTHMYVIDHDNATLNLVDIETGVLEGIGTSLAFTDLACDKSTGIMYGAMYNDPSSFLYTIDLETGVPTLIGSIGEGIIISLACDGDGNLWGLNLDDNLYSIDKSTGAMTLIGSVGFDANYAQSMAWDPSSGIVYMAAYNNVSNSGELRIVDTETGATQLVGAFPGAAELTAFGFPGGGSSDFLNVSPISGTIAPNSSLDINIEMDATLLPNGDYNSSVTVYSNDFDNPSIGVPVNLTVSGQIGEAEVSTNFIEFGAVFLHGDKSMPLVIRNTGIGDLTISSISSSLQFFTTDLESESSIEMGDSLVVMANFASQFLGQFNGILTINTNDPSNEQIKVTVTGIAISPPVISVNPTELELTLDAGDISTEHFAIKNAGMYPLQYSMPSIALNRLLADPKVQKNNTSRIDELPVLNSKEEADTRVGHPVVLGAGGPDNFGYIWIDSKETGGPVYSWTDISTTGTEIIPGSDDGSVQLDLPFGFKFYGEVQSSVLVSSNGYLTFGTNGSDYTNDQIPSTSTPNNFIAPFWDDLRPSSKRGHIFYEASSDKFVVQYHEVGNYPSSTTGTISFQVILYPNGNIEYAYNEISLEENASATIGVENTDGTIGLQVAFNTSYVESEMAVLIIPGKTPFDVEVSPLSGIVQPNSEQEIVLSIDATDLIEDSYINKLIISSNDPLNPIEIFTTNLDVIGRPEIAVSPEEIVFSSIFQGLSETKSVQIDNTGSKNLTISSIVSDEASFSADTIMPLTISANQSLIIPVSYTALSIGEVTGILTIVSDDDYGNDSVYIAVSGTGLIPPEMSISTDPDPVDLTLNHGEIDTIVVSIENAGGSPLDYVIVKPYYTTKGGVNVSSEPAKPELSSKDVADNRSGFPVLTGSGGPDMFGYSWLDSDENAEVSYDWIEISTIGTLLELGGDDGTIVSLPFNFPFYNQTYNEVQVASNGFLTFDDELGSIGGYSNQDIPSTTLPNNLIAPMWDDIEPQNGDGVYVYSTSSYIVVQYNEVPKYWGNGLATFQVILYASGDIKFQYKDVSTYSGITDSSVGIENEDGTDALNIVFNTDYIKDELAVLIQSPFISGTVEEGLTANIDLIVNTNDINDGIYESAISVMSNDPANSFVEIPTALTVIGTPEISFSTDTVRFDDIFYIDGEENSSYSYLYISNTGSKTLIIDSLYFDQETDVFEFDSSLAGALQMEIEPNDSNWIFLSFTPNSVGHFESYLNVRSNDLYNPLTEILLEANAIDPPVLTVLPADTLLLTLRSDDSVTTISTVTNQGGSLLDYDARVLFMESFSEQQQSVERIYTPFMSANEVNRSSIPANRINTYAAEKTFDISVVDSIIYDPDGPPADYYGYNSTAAYSAANRFVVESTSFKLTHIANYYQNQGVTIPVIMEIWGEGYLPEEGVLLATQSYYHPEATNGANCLIELEKPLYFEQGDVFFVAMHYPQDINFPAAFNDSVTWIDSVSYWFDVNDGIWLPEYSGTVYKIRAYEAAGALEDSWLSITPEFAQLNPGESQNHNLVANAALTTSGNHYAKVVYSSNDPVNPVFEQPVQLYVNQLPEILIAPLDTIYIDEGTSLDVVIAAIDPEGGMIEYELAESYPFTLMESVDTAVVTHSPGFEDAGQYEFIMNIIDEMNEVISLTWQVIVNDVNRMPVLITDIDSRLYFSTDLMDEIDLSAHFMDPDGDEMTFTCNNSNTEAYELDIIDHMLYIDPIEIGFGVVTVSAWDSEGMHSDISFNVRVRHTENHAPELIELIDNLILNPNSSSTIMDLNDYFIDIDWDEIEYSFFLAGTASVNVSLTGSELEISSWQTGMAVITIYADDNRGGVTATTMGVMVVGEGNGLPFLSSLLDNRNYTSLSNQDLIDLNSIFEDPDKDQLTYIAQIESGNAVEVSVDNNMLSITPLEEGESSIVVYASDDNSGIASTRFKATVVSPTGINNYEITKNSLTNYPNPAKHLTTFEYKLVETAHIKLEIIDMTGRSLGLVVDEKQSVGKHLVEFNVDKLNSGVYLYRLIIDGEQVKINSITIE